jgi:histidine triad (HIT) family protein
VSSDCVFCSIVAGRTTAQVLFEDDGHLAFFPLVHINPGHVLVIPKDHVDYLFDLSPAAYASLWAAAARVAGALRKVTSAKRIGVAVEGFSVAHAHVHLVPVNGSDELNPLRAQPVDDQTLARLAGSLQAELAAGSR